MTVYFSGAAVGSALSTIAWVHWKWNGVCALALTFIAVGGLRHATGLRTGEARSAGAETRTERAVLEI
jgi:hypothetical protein